LAKGISWTRFHKVFVFAISISRFLFMACFLASYSILFSSASNRLDEIDDRLSLFTARFMTI
jgi:hypothetical protein